VQASRLASLVGALTDDRPPLYDALARRLRLLVGDGRLPVGTRLPAERELAAALHVSRATVTAAYGRLRDDGWAVARQGSGTWTRLPTAAGTAELGSWVPSPPQSGVLELAHAAPAAAPPEVAAAFRAALEDLPRVLPTHGYYPHGLPELRARLADRFTARGLPTTPEQVVVTGGALQAAAAALSVLARRGDRVLVEHPSYPNVLDALAAQGARLVPVAVDADRPERVARDVLRAAKEAAPTAAYLMPDFQNPTGLLLDEPQRRRLAVGLEQTGTVAVVDETLVDLGLDADPGLPFAACARPGAVVTVGTTSKSFWGGLRVGWLRADPDQVGALAAAVTRTQLGTPVLEQLAVCHLLDGAEALLAAHRERLRGQRDALVRALGEQLPAWRVRVPDGGLVLWCELPSRTSSALVSAAADRGLRLAAGPRFGQGAAFEDRLRLPYTQPVDVLQRAVALLAEADAAVGSPRRRAVEESLVV
jgi:DNA-binding transcriptional MocR family regulator